MARQFTGWKADDGTVFATRAEAEEHDHDTAFHAWCRDNICVGGEWTATMVARVILTHWHLLRRQPDAAIAP